MKNREEKDFLGKVRIEGGMLYGTQTQRALDHFPPLTASIDREIISTYALIKKAAALANYDLGLLTKEKKEAICAACEEIISHHLDEHFPLSIWQASAGTNINMNINEVIAHWIKKHTNVLVDAHDDVNLCQSTNDTFVAMIHLILLKKIEKKLFLAIDKFTDVLQKKMQETKNIKKVARTHLMDAVSIKLSDELSSYYAQMGHAKKMLQGKKQRLLELPLGATAVGTKIGAHPQFSKIVIKKLQFLTKKSFKLSTNFFESVSSSDPLVEISSSCKLIATILFKMATDIALLASGPKAGLGELFLPENEPGSSIMPGKINPTQCDFLKMVSMQVISNDTTVALCAMNGNFSLNVYRPLMLHSLMQSIDFLSEGISSFTDHCLKGIKPNLSRIKKHLQQSYVDAVLMNEILGYDEASQNVHDSLKHQ